MKLNTKLLVAFVLCVSASMRLIFPVTTAAQVRPVNDYGALGVAQLLKRLNTTASVMMIGAHPDDEDSALLAYLARGESARTAYLSLTRGEGGQNLIGPELGEALGIIRTEELLQARRLDGAEQYFTRAYDYGFSKTLAEAKAKWPEEVIKCDVVRAIRQFRPLVVISRFTGTPADGHGHHQYSGYITPIAVKAAADPQQCSDAGTPWQVLKFYVEQSFSDKSEPTLKINTGQYDPILGRSYYEIAMEGRSMHRSQGEGRLELHGEQFSGLNLVGATKDKSEKNIFEGINTSLTGLLEILRINDKDDAQDLREMEGFIHEAQSSSRQDNPVATLSALVSLLKRLPPILRAEIQALPINGGVNRDFDHLGSELSVKRSQASAAVKLAVGLQIDALSNAETVAPGETFSVVCNIFYAGELKIKVKEIMLSVPQGWFIERTGGPNGPSPNSRREAPKETSCFAISVPKDAKPTQPYWLEAPQDGDLYKWPKANYLTYSFQPPSIKAVIKAEIDGTEVTFDEPVQFRYADPARGEIRREVNVVPQLSVSVTPELLIVPISASVQKKTIAVTITNNSSVPVEGTFAMNIVGGGTWKYSYERPTFHLQSKGAKVTVSADIVIPDAKDAFFLIPYGDGGKGEASFTMRVAAYPHIQTHRYYTRALTTVVGVDLKTVPVKVGYVMGSGDEVPEAIRQMGMDLTMLEEKDLVSGDLSRFDTIVVGIRASETRPDLLANKERLMDYVSGGGNLIMQYQRGNFAKSGLLPYRVDMEDKQGTTAGTVSRVVDENAKVTILEQANPVFNFPNKITDEDFKGWVQERDAYNLVTFDPKYTPLLESHDAGEQENKGGLVIAKVGKGNWIYCSYSLFRQLPGGVPGAYRLFANLLSLPKAH